jgi:hypothetical protein
MQSCCTPGAAIVPAICPSCGRAGRAVSRVTVGALARLEVDAVLLATKDYRFCETPVCPVVYYSPAGVRLDRTDVRAAVHQKGDGPEVPLCYCFGYTRARLTREGDAGVAFVSAEVNARRCACDLKNPSGRCCLGDLRQFLRHRDSKAAAPARSSVRRRDGGNSKGRSEPADPPRES